MSGAPWERALRGFCPILAVVSLGGLALGVSSFFHGFYDPLVWVPIGVGLVAVTIAATVAGRPPQLTRPAWGTLIGLLGLAVWSLWSSQWSDSVERALVETNRTIVLLAVLTCALLLIRSGRASKWLLVGLGTGIAVVGLHVCQELLGSTPNSQFLSGRLDLPLGYVNAQGTVFAMGFWIFVAAAEHRRPLVAAFGAGGAALMLSLALLSQSRGVALALGVSAFLVISLAPGRLRRSGLLAVVGVGVALTAGKLLAIYHAAQIGAVPVSVFHAAGAVMILSLLGTALVWGGLTAIQNTFVQNSPELAARIRGAAALGSALAALLVVVAAIASAGSIRHEVGTQWSTFTHLSEQSTVASQTASSRLLTGAGNRADYWRVAWHAWQANPVRGYGAGNYDVPYFRSRRTIEPVRQPHSIELQALSELGLVGFVFLTLFVGGIAAGTWRMRDRAQASLSERSLMVAALGVASAWFIHTSVDWIHLVPGATGIALVAATILIRCPDGVRSSRRASQSRPRHSTGLAALSGTLMLVATLSLTRQGLSDASANRAQHELASQPASALRDAESALRIDPYKVESYYTEAAVLAHFGRALDARAALLSAVRLEPNNFVTWVLLGDIATRTGNSGLAAGYYARASALNPREPALAR